MQDWLKLGFDLISEVGRFSESPGARELPRGLLSKLKEYWEDDRIRFSDNARRLGGYNHLTKVITLSRERLHFLNHDFDRQISMLDEQGDHDRVMLVRAKKQRCLFELTGLLIHEGQHAYQPIFSWNPLRLKACRKQDEENAYRAEQLWYWMLYQEFEVEAIRQLASQAAYDATNSPAYRRLGIEAPALV